MKITFPHMGHLYIPLKTLFEELEIEVILPPFNNDEMKSIGCKYSPEYSCIPFKLVLGNVLHCLERGADTVVMLGGSGPCRFGYFGHLLNMIAVSLGYRFEFICLEPSTLPRDLYGLKKLAGCSYGAMAKSLALGWKKLEAIDTLERKYWACLPYFREKNRYKDILQQAVNHMVACRYVQDIGRITHEYSSTMDSLCHRSHRFPRVAIIGDIYTLNEPYSNQNIEMLLTDRDIETHRTIYTSSWVKNSLLPWKKKAYYNRARAWAKGYLDDSIGGFALDTVYHAIQGAHAGFAGIIHIFPVTCMPEIVSCQILQKVSRQKKIPIMSLTIDEHMEKTGLETRIEAFSELLHNKKPWA